MDERRLTACVAELLAGAGLEALDLSISAVAGGGNNRVFAVHTRDAQYLAKAYFSHPSDPRDRLGAEWAFLSYAWDIGLRCIPRPIGRNFESSLGLYEFIDGRKLASTEIDSTRMNQALEFFVQLNGRLARGQAQGLNEASEACFAVDQHLALLDRRIERLRAAPALLDIDREAAGLVRELRVTWGHVREDILRYCGSSSVAATLPAEDRCISPSDFGFHNALLRPSGELCFLDFEYAGWDDPAKAVGDFFCQPAVPVALEHFDTFVAHATGYSRHARALEQRVRLMLPLFQIKWCCIMLNEFLPDAARRRSFASPDTDPEQRKRLQLEKARRYFHSITRESWLT